MDIKQLFGIDHPILQAPMAGASNPDLVAAVSNAGGLGGLGAAAMPPETLRKQVQAIKQKTNQAFNVNLFAPASEIFDQEARPGEKLRSVLAGYHHEFGLGEIPSPGNLFGPAELQLQVLLDEKVPVISFHFGIERAHVDAIHAAGLKVICTATHVSEATLLERFGVDAVIAQGSEAGGHRGTFLGAYQDALIGTLALVPQIVDAVSIPVIAAGGVMDARGIIACHALGAQAVQLGTAFLGCPESGIPDAWRQSLLASQASQTTVTEAMSGKPARGIRNRYITEVEKLDEPLLPYPLQYAISGALRKQAAETDNPDFMAMWSGQGVGLIQPLSAAELMQKLITDTEKLRKQLASSN
ncbi:MAG: nitronate monooxygenase [Gammaproteobacteria bacterium]|jgi:nitronate monooxygenase|nr:nitronate monooxygenase [Gammaproteobacteria bacterium]